MTKHDTWVKLKPNNPYQPIMDLFPDGMIPMRDPFPLERASSFGGASLWIIDLERLSSAQVNALAHLIALHRSATALEVATEAIDKGGFAMNHEWVESMQCGDEGFQRSQELADFLETAPQPPSAEAWETFFNDQVERWIDGNEEPRPINSIEDVDPRLRTPELELRFKMLQIEAIATSGYSVLDVLTGRSMVDSLNIIDPANLWDSLVDEYDDFEDDEIYE